MWVLTDVPLRSHILRECLDPFRLSLLENLGDPSTLGFIDSIASEFEFCKDGSKVSVQIQILHFLQS